MFFHSLQFPLLVMIAICFSHPYVLAQSAQSVQSYGLHAVDARICFFADEMARFGYTTMVRRSVKEGPVSWNVHWSLSAANRTLKRGTCQAKVVADSKPLRYVVEIPMPELRDEVTLPIQLSMHWRSGESELQRTRQIHLFAREAFTHRQEFLKKAQIALFDPENHTARLLDEHEIPYSRLVDLAAVELVNEGVVLVGEGVSLREQRKLLETLYQAVSRGVSVICLAPSEGEVPFAAESEGLTIYPQQLILAREDVVHRYDKRFDPLHTLTPLVLDVTRSGSVVQAASWEDDLSRSDYWSWLELEFIPQTPGKPNSKMIVCGLGLVEPWDDSPVPRYLFLRLLEKFNSTQAVLEKENNDEFIQR